MSTINSKSGNSFRREFGLVSHSLTSGKATPIYSSIDFSTGHYAYILADANWTYRQCLKRSPASTCLLRPVGYSMQHVIAC
ncbi:hypothetical protein CEXT_783311 [Caerostris extrusa]|uniref:Uncharacterized protein n=1 Tax=Caerostris extrusa TaxID=172846 RepID=A0AAV4V7U7_CAEEX|nr:hypothetical protein CEXT_783311 [Caerostris extrusa]